MNNKVVGLGTTLSFLKLMQHDERVFDDIYYTIRGLERNLNLDLMSDHIGKLIALCTYAVLIYLQVEIARDKKAGVKTNNSFSTIAMIVFDMMTTIYLRSLKFVNKEQRDVFTIGVVKIAHSVFLIFTLLGYGRGVNLVSSMKYLGILELLLLLSTTEMVPQFMTMIIMVMVPLMWHEYDKVRNKDTDKESKMFMIGNIARIVLMGIALVMFYS